MNEQAVSIHTPFIKLEALLKLEGLAETGGAAKEVIQQGEVLVNDQNCTQRGKKLYPGGTAEFSGVRLRVQ